MTENDGWGLYSLRGPPIKFHLKYDLDKFAIYVIINGFKIMKGDIMNNEPIKSRRVMEYYDEEGTNIKLDSWNDSSGGAHRTDDRMARQSFDEYGRPTVQEWSIHGKRHRIGKPAMIDFHEDSESISVESWYRLGKFHNLVGPARIYHGINGSIIKVEWYVAGHEYTFVEWLQMVDLDTAAATALKLTYI